MADSAIDRVVVIFANGRMYRENAFNEKLFFFLEGMDGESCMKELNVSFMAYWDI